MFRLPRPPGPVVFLEALHAKRAPVRTLTHALTGLTGCACLAAVPLWGMRGTWSLNVLHLLLCDLNTS